MNVDEAARVERNIRTISRDLEALGKAGFPLYTSAPPTATVASGA